MKTIIRKGNSNTGYELVTIDDQNNEVVKPIEKTYPNEPYTLILPANEVNRKYFNSKKVDNAGGEIELTYKETRLLGPRTESTPRKGLEEYLEGEEKELYLKLVEKAKKNRDSINKPLTELEKAKRAYERALKKVQELENREVK